MKKTADADVSGSEVAILDESQQPCPLLQRTLSVRVRRRAKLISFKCRAGAHPASQVKQYWVPHWWEYGNAAAWTQGSTVLVVLRER
jgi:hypothetical protein